MKLYHGTNNEQLIQILKSGYLDNTKAFEDTLYVDEIIENYLGKKLTNDAIYLSNDIISTQMSFDYEFELVVDKDLNREKLFVAEYNYRDEIMAYGDDCKEGIEAIENYIKSFISYDEYVSKSFVYENPEFLYFDKINIKAFNKEILNHLEEYEEELCDLNEREIEMDLETFINLSHKLNRNTEYILQNKYGDTYCLNYDLSNDNGNFKILYMEHHYTKFWNRNIQAKEYLKLKIKFAKKCYSNIEAILESEDDCHPTLVLSLLCNENEVIKMVESLEKLHEDFDKRCDVLENEIEKLISNFEL